MNSMNPFLNFILYDVYGVRKFTDKMKSIVFRWKIHIISRILFSCRKIKHLMFLPKQKNLLCLYFKTQAYK